MVLFAQESVSRGLSEMVTMTREDWMTIINKDFSKLYTNPNLLILSRDDGSGSKSIANLDGKKRKFFGSRRPMLFDD